MSSMARSSRKSPPSKMACIKCGQQTLELVSFSPGSWNEQQVLKVKCSNCGCEIEGHDAPYIHVLNHWPTKPQLGHEYVPDWWPGMTGTIIKISDKGAVQVMFIGGQIRWYKPSVFRESFTHSDKCLECQIEKHKGDSNVI